MKREVFLIKKFVNVIYIFSFCLNKKNTIFHSFVCVCVSVLVWSRDNYIIILGLLGLG